jgi:hypothetical protein
MKLIAAVAASIAALAVASGAGAAPPAPQQDGFAGTHAGSFKVKKLTPGEAKKLGVPDALLPGQTVDSNVTAPSPDALGPCGLCINTCWVTTFRTGDDTTTGSYWEYDNPVWCGNGSWITYADVSRHWQYVSIWYSADGEAGPWFDGGCVGCTSIHFTLYGYFSWHPPIWPVSHTTLRLGVWMQAYGSAAYA